MRATENGVSQYPKWRCKSCGKEYPYDFEGTKCIASKGASLCWGPLHRFIRYEVKQPGVRYEGIPPNRKLGRYRA